MRSNFEINKWFCFVYTIAFFAFVVIGCSQDETLVEPIQVVLREVEPVRPSTVTQPDPLPVVPEVVKEPKKPEPAEVKTKQPATIIMYESGNCVWCKYWWSSHRVSWEKAGWKVLRKHYSEFTGTNAPAGVPFFEVWDTEKTFIVRQLLDAKVYKESGGK